MDDSVDYRLVCRTCLASQTDFYQLDARAFWDDDEKISFLECLKFCTKLEDNPEFPIYICTDCSTALQVAYNFMKNALEAHEILRQKLCSSQPSRINRKYEAMQGDRKISFRCKICEERLESKKSLKEHVKLHIDIISYNCEFCSYKTQKRSSLNQHYIDMHNMSATKEQLKPRTKKSDPIEPHRAIEPVEPHIKDLPTIQPEIESHKIINEITIDSVDENQFPYFQTQPLREIQSIPKSNLLSSRHQQTQQQQHLNAAQLFQDIPLEMATVIATAPNSSNQPIEISANLTSFENEFNSGNEMSIGNEFVVMHDGTVQEVISNGILINYINAGDELVPLDNGNIINNLMQTTEEEVITNTNENFGMINGPIQSDVATVGTDLDINIDTGNSSMDIDDIIVEDSAETVGIAIPEVSSNNSTTNHKEPEASIGDMVIKQIRCKLCKLLFSNQDELKEHMLSHNEIPHFFCETCNFYTFFKIDLNQHYKTKHGTQPNNKQLQPRNKVHFNVPKGVKRVFLCEMCIYDTPVKAILRRHYLSKHQVEATEMQLRPVRISSLSSLNKSTPTTLDEGVIISKYAYHNTSNLKDAEVVRPDFPHGAKCKDCNKIFFWESDRIEHYKGKCERKPRKKVSNTITKNVTVTTINNGSTTDDLCTFQDDPELDIEKLIACTELKATIVREPPPSLPPTPRTALPAPTQPSLPMPLQPTLPSPSQSPSRPPSQPIPSVINSKVGLGSCDIVPPDAIPQIVETDSVVDNILDFDINGDTMFEDDDERNGDEDFQDMALTTDDEKEYEVARDKDNSGSSYTAYCVQCNQDFVTHYQFENHMFVHRGLAPYRCELCTNLYNTKRDLIRHYLAVHKTAPTRDMIQAKGDKVAVPVDNVSLTPGKIRDAPLICAKCPYETTDLTDIKIHLNIIHGSDEDGLILHKLPYECPKCIRTFDSCFRLNHHIKRNHSTNLVCHQNKDNNDNITNKCDLNSL